MTEGAHRLGIRIYYEDTDFSGVVYHANYLRFLERGRTELLRHRGVSQHDMRDPASGEALAFAVRRIEADFLAPARMDDEIVVQTAVRTVGGASLTLEQTIERGETPLIRAVVQVVVVGGGRARRLPADLRALFDRARISQAT